jgi:hypothetical protein
MMATIRWPSGAASWSVTAGEPSDQVIGAESASVASRLCPVGEIIDGSRPEPLSAKHTLGARPRYWIATFARIGLSESLRDSASTRPNGSCAHRGTSLVRAAIDHRRRQPGARILDQLGRALPRRRPVQSPRPGRLRLFVEPDHRLRAFGDQRQVGRPHDRTADPLRVLTRQACSTPRRQQARSPTASARPWRS